MQLIYLKMNLYHLEWLLASFLFSILFIFYINKQIFIDSKCRFSNLDSNQINFSYSIINLKK